MGNHLYNLPARADNAFHCVDRQLMNDPTLWRPFGARGGYPNEVLTLLLAALDPETGGRIGEAEVKSNILTFIMAGHETTANLLSGSLFLLSQADLWRQRLHLEAEREINGSVADLADHLPVTRAVIEEAARLYPPIAAISRVALVQSWLARRSPRGCWL